MHVSMIRDGERRLLELESPGDEVIDPVGAVKEGVFGVAVQMDEGHPVRIGVGPWV